MLILVTGGSKCGKSGLAEKIITSIGSGKLYYIATMQPFGSDAEEAIDRHRKMRAGKGFETVEQYTDIGNAPVGTGSRVLVECLGNLMANEMFGNNITDPSEKIAMGIKALAERSEIVVIVSNQVGEDNIPYSSETMQYINNMGRTSALIAGNADIVIESVFGIPVMLKGEKPLCLL